MRQGGSPKRRQSDPEVWPDRAPIAYLPGAVPSDGRGAPANGQGAGTSVRLLTLDPPSSATSPGPADRGMPPDHQSVAGRWESALTIGLTAVLVAGWATHILVCILNGLWGFLAVGLLIWPVAVVHGLLSLVTIWF
jgi:hypothetical protein